MLDFISKIIYHECRLSPMDLLLLVQGLVIS
uniref:Uncharacterized protein n=1 Tax=Anguilla anguilla TaxID=7936 RepID=A0A0E9UWY4_ANGAN